MTKNQIDFARLQEDKRANRAKELQNEASLTETARSNLAKESETHRSNLVSEFETNRSNKAREAESHRSNVANENLNAFRNQIEEDKLGESQRHNAEQERYLTNKLIIDTGQRQQELNTAQDRHNLDVAKFHEQERQNTISNIHEDIRLQQSGQNSNAKVVDTVTNVIRVGAALLGGV